MNSAGKEGNDPNVVPSSALRKRGTPGSSSPAKRLAKRRQSMRNRRVSFAPDPELTMVHTFETDDYHPGAMSPAFPPKISEEEPSAAQKPHSPQDMDITQHLKAVQEEEPVQQEADAAWNAMLASEPGDITAAVPSLGALAEADELEDLVRTDGPDMQQFVAADYDNVTGAVPRLGALLEEDEEDEEIFLGRAAAETGVDMEMTVALGAVLTKNVDNQEYPSPISQQAAADGNNTDNITTGGLLRSTPSPTNASEVREEGQANKWGFIPGDDDTMELDLEEHGRMIMGDRTYAGMYGDGCTTGGTTAQLLGGRGGAGDTPDSVTIHGANNTKNGRNPSISSPAANAENGAPGPRTMIADADGGVPVNWTMPAFVPPYLAAGDENKAVDSDHPALHQSPALTNSSLNTMSTRRISVDARRASVTSRRASMFTGGQGDTGALLAASIGAPPAGGGAGASPTGKLSDVTEDLLADEDEGEEVGNGGGISVGGYEGAGGAGDLLAGLQQQVRMLSKGSPAASGFSPASAAFGGPSAKPTGAATKTPFSVGYADSSYNPATAGLLRTGGTTGLLNDTTGEAADIGAGIPVENNNELTRGTHNTHGTTRLLRMDATASSAIAAGAKALLNNNNNDDDDITAPLVSPTMHGHHKMSHSPPASALSGGSMPRHQYYQQQQYGHGGSVLRNGGGAGTPPGMHSVRSNRSASKLGRTPIGSVMRGPGGSMMIPSAGGPGTHGPYAAPPGSAIAARYPGSAVAQGRLSQGFTPSLAPAITFQDFAKIVEVQFLDNLRRGSSINYADLAPNPVPTTLVEAYNLLCITSPNLAELETAVHTLRSEASRLRASASELEMMLGGTNPPIFRHVQIASLEQLEAFRSNVGLLKRVCRAKAVVLLKDVRCQMEDSKAGRLARAADGLRTDLAFINQQASHTRGVVAAAEKYAEETRERLAIDAEARVVESERRKRVAAARSALEEARTANAERVRRLEEASARVVELQREREALAADHSEVQVAAENARAALSRLTALAVAAGKDPRSILTQIRAVERLGACLGIKVEQTSFQNGSMVVSLRVGPIFKLELTSTPAGFRGTVHVVAASSIPSRSSNSSGRSFNTVRGQPTEAQRSLAAAVAGFGPSGGEAFFVDPSGAPAAVQSTLARLQRCSDLVGELCYVRDLYRNICEVSAAPGGAAGLRLVFVGRHADVRFAVTLTPGPAYPLGSLTCATKIYFDGDGQVTAADVTAAVARAPAGPGRIRAVCAELSDMVVKLAPKAAGQTGAFLSAFGNPLFGSNMGAVQPVA
ncbi:hypothetical protein Ndes2526B_g07208 [Nannochloris sp. 'desiccata']